MVHFDGAKLRGRPKRATKFSLAIDPDDAVAESDEANNTARVNDVKVDVSNPDVVRKEQEGYHISDRSFETIREVLREVGHALAVLTSSVRTPREQAEQMFKELIGIEETTNYLAPGQQVIAWYRSMTRKKNKTQIRRVQETILVAMTKLIKELHAMTPPQRVSNTSSTSRRGTRRT